MPFIIAYFSIKTWLATSLKPQRIEYLGTVNPSFLWIYLMMKVYSVLDLILFYKEKLDKEKFFVDRTRKLTSL